MATNMTSKFEKYWDKIHGVIAVVVVLDPRYKMDLIDYFFPRMYGIDCELETQRIFELCNDMVSEYQTKEKGGVGEGTGEYGVGSSFTSSSSSSSMWDVKGFESYKRKHGRQRKLTSELETYLEQEEISGSEEFDILLWWKMQKGRYPILSKIARDVLAIPVSTVAFELAFSTGGRTLSSHRSRLHPHTVEALMCTQNWIWAQRRGKQIPNYIGSLKTLKHLNLSWAGFDGKIPYQVENLSRLQSLDLSYNFPTMYVDKLEWLSHLASLRQLQLSSIDLAEALDWLQVVSELPCLTELQLGLSSLPSVNSSKTLTRLHLFGNHLPNSSIYSWLSNFSSNLIDMDLFSTIPDYVYSNMTCLLHFDLGYNQIVGLLMKSFGNLCSLKTLSLALNNLTGHLPQLFFSCLVVPNTL
ncbi:hypothetical protein Dsin_024414 [Dipteronia sinensis]|uniref:HAT C-terminal dimerisation domain-containing protein n=1 Tax=Dipteronia sinensis TaxID=43782 RepID=A0AAD9ZU67_9ROSI|nr:hypothetical protein Dsin_024414 [Dipteronia sinensis]